MKSDFQLLKKTLKDGIWWILAFIFFWGTLSSIVESRILPTAIAYLIGLPVAFGLTWLIHKLIYGKEGTFTEVNDGKLRKGRISYTGKKIVEEEKILEK